MRRSTEQFGGACGIQQRSVECESRARLQDPAPRVRHPECLAIVLMLALPAVAFAQHEGDVWVGRSSAGRLAIAGFVPDENIIVLPPIAAGGLFKGWSDNSPGFDRAVADDPESDFYRLAAGASIDLELVRVDPAFRAIDTGFQILDGPGERTHLGNQNLHTHITWHLNSADPAFDPLHCVWEAVFVLRDLGTTGYLDSAPLTFRFATHLPIRADFDCDTDVDSADLEHLLECVLGPAIPQVRPDCRDADLDEDGDVDQADFGIFQRCYSGQDVPGDPGCGGSI